jgi:oxalate decarboxylase
MRNESMSDKEQQLLSRRKFIEGSSAALIAAAGLRDASAQQANVPRSPDHHLPNESEPGPNNTALDQENPDSDWAPATDEGGQPPFKYSFSLSHKRLEQGGWTRQVTVRDLPISKKMAGVQMRLIKGGVRELHWHVGAEWALMLYGLPASRRLTSMDAAMSAT